MVLFSSPAHVGKWPLCFTQSALEVLWGRNSSSGCCLKTFQWHSLVRSRKQNLQNVSQQLKRQSQGNCETLLKKILSPHHFCVTEDGSAWKTDADDTPWKVNQKRKTGKKFWEYLTNLLNLDFHFLRMCNNTFHFLRVHNMIMKNVHLDDSKTAFPIDIKWKKIK